MVMSCRSQVSGQSLFFLMIILLPLYNWRRTRNTHYVEGYRITPFIMVQTPGIRSQAFILRKQYSLARLPHTNGDYRNALAPAPLVYDIAVGYMILSSASYVQRVILYAATSLKKKTATKIKLWIQTFPSP